MILILSENEDFTTYKVVKCLENRGEAVCILTPQDCITCLNVQNNDVTINVGENQLKFSDIKAYWYRRGDFSIDYSIPETLDSRLSQDLWKERSSILELLHVKLSSIPSLASIYNSDLNRVVTIWYAAEAGLLVPDIGIFSIKKDLQLFKEKYDKIIIKPLRNGLGFIDDNKLYINYTTLFTGQDIDKLPENFKPALFMKYIDKSYELRVFFLDGLCCTMAIFSQRDKRTEVDYRVYNKEYPNRISVYELPIVIEDKINKLMQKLKLKIGTIDLIVTPENEYLFLEVNPVGQFINLDECCHFNLPDLVAGYLQKISKESI